MCLVFLTGNQTKRVTGVPATRFVCPQSESLELANQSNRHEIIESRIKTN